MNNQPELKTADPSVGPAPANGAVPDESISEIAWSAQTGRRRHGKVASLPKPVRDQIKSMMLMGVNLTNRVAKIFYSQAVFVIS
jgi:hypothetical protein